MTDKEKYRRLLEEQLKEWARELGCLKRKAEVAGADLWDKLPDQIELLEARIEVGAAKIKELAETNEDTWITIQDSFVTAWQVISAGFKEAADKFKWDLEKKE